MLNEVLRPACLFLFVCMIFSAATELLPSPWLDLTLGRTTGIAATYYLLFASAIMFVLRQTVGWLSRHINAPTMLTISAMIATAGMMALGMATTPLQGFAAVGLWAVGACFLWPTMMVLMSERHPKAGALGMGLLGTMGTLSDFIVQPVFGSLFDRFKMTAAGGAEALAALSASQVEAVSAQAAHLVFLWASILPAMLLPLMGVMKWMKSGEKQRS